MRRFGVLTAALMVLAGFVGFVSLASRGSDSNEPRLEQAGRSPTDLAIAQAQQRLADAPDDRVSLNELGFAYLQKARESGDPSFYTQAGGIFGKALMLDPADQQGLLGMSSVAAARHDFTLALDFSQKALQLDPLDADARGALGDALIELGRYEEALAAFQAMLDARPDLNAYVRVAYARELYGDVDGAIQAMEEAIEASRPTGETAAWVHSQLGNLYFNSGELVLATEEYDASAAAFPDYVHAVAGHARVAAANGDLEKATELYGKVVTRQPVLEYVVALGDVYRASGKEDEAQRQYDLVAAINSLYEANGVTTDLEMSVFLADHHLDLDEAIAQARAIHESQPESIRAADALSWALYKAGRAGEALPYSKQALRLGTKDPTLLFHAGMVHEGAGLQEEARTYLTQALDSNPHFSVLHAGEAAAALEQLNAAVEARQ
jgi:tetratricopeptide (TPR) repeat protein